MSDQAKIQWYDPALRVPTTTLTVNWYTREDIKRIATTKCAECGKESWKCRCGE